MKEWKTVFWLFSAAAGYRILQYLLFSDKIVALSDPMQNIILARRFASGDLYGVLDTYWTPVYPVLVGIISFFINDLILPAIIVSIIAGSLAVPLTYYLVKQSYGEREAVIAAVIAIFYPYLINSVFSIGTENIYLVWMMGALIVGWKGLQSDSAKYFLLTGLLVGLAYLTRPEAIGYPLFFILVIVFKNLRRKKLLARGPWMQIGALLLGFAILTTPYFLYLRSATGAWTISGKAVENFAVGALKENDEQVNAPSPGLDRHTSKVIIWTVALNLREIQNILTILLPFALLIFIALGLFGEKWDQERLKRESYLILFCLVTVFGYAATVPLERYFYVLLPIFFGWMARGIVQSEQWFHATAQNWKPNKLLSLLDSRAFVVLCLILIYLYMFPINFYIRSTESAWQGAAFEERDAGTWLKENGKKSAKIFSASFRPVFYADGKQIWEETKDVREIIAKIKENKVDYVVDNERSYKKHSFLRNFSELLKNDPQFELIYQRNDQPGYKISIFKLKENSAVPPTNGD